MSSENIIPLNRQSDEKYDDNLHFQSAVVPERHRFPYCIVWTPIPLLTWIFPFIGHMGIAFSNGIITDFAGSYTVSEDDMAFGWPTKYWQLDLNSVGREKWDDAVTYAAVEYRKRMHNLFCDNCHSHVACALNQMSYKGTSEWNMAKLTWRVVTEGKYTGFLSILQTWVPFLIVIILTLTVIALSV